MCGLSCKDSAAVSLPQSLHQTAPVPKEAPRPEVKPQPKPRVNMELNRQKKMMEDGLALIQQIRVHQHFSEIFRI